MEGDKDPEVTAEASEDAPPPPSPAVPAAGDEACLGSEKEKGEVAVVQDVEAVAPESARAMSAQASHIRQGLSGRIQFIVLFD